MFEAATPMSMILSWGIGLAVLYAVIRFAVRHAIQDADRRRSGERPKTR